MQSNRRLQLHLVQTPTPASLPAVLISKSGACDSCRLVIVGAGAVSRSFFTFHDKVQRSCKAVEDFSKPKPANPQECSITHFHKAMRDLSCRSTLNHPATVTQVNPVLSSPCAEQSVYGFTHQRSSTRNSSEGSDDSEWTNSSNHGNVKKQRLNVSSSSKWSHGRKTEEWDPAHEIEADMQAAAALVKLCSDETPAGDFFRRSWSSLKNDGSVRLLWTKNTSKW